MDANEYETSLVPPLPSFNVNVWGVVASWGVPKSVRVCPSSDREALVPRLVVQAFRKSSIGEEAMVGMLCWLFLFVVCGGRTRGIRPLKSRADEGDPSASPPPN